MSSKEVNSLEEKAKELKRDYEQRKEEISIPDFPVIEFLYKIQAGIIHHGSDFQKRQKLIDIFNSLPLHYRKHAYQNYEGDGLVTDREQYKLRMRRQNDTGS
jgi:hypothetical protein